MKIQPFVMERWQSTWENTVEINLSESGVHPLRVRDLLDEPDLQEALLDERLVYTQTNGTEELRALIASLHTGADVDHVEVTNGGAEANFIACWNLLESGDEVVVMTPNYGQVLGLAPAFGGRTRHWPMRTDKEETRWVVDMDELRSLVGDRTRLILLCNPNNPTGARLSSSELDEIGAPHQGRVVCQLV